MKLVCPQNSLNENLSLVSRAVPSRPSHPVLANVLVIADEDAQQIRLCAFDLSLGIQTSFSAQVEEGGKLTLPAKLLNDIVSRLPNEEIALGNEAKAGTDAEASGLTTLVCSSGRYQVRGMDAEEFPELPIVDDGQAVQLPADALIDGLRGVLFAASGDEAKQILTGVHLTISEQGLEFAATDGHRLAVVHTSDPVMDATGAPAEGLDLAVTIPAKALQELAKLLDRHAGQPVTVKFDQSQIVVEWPAQRLTSRLLEGQYPNYRQLIPSRFERSLTVDRRLLLSALERIAVLADQKNNIVKLTLSQAEQELALVVDAPDVGSGREVMSAQITGDDLDIAFNVRYLLDGLKALNAPDIQIQLNSATTPVILTPVSGTKMTYLVMPVQIRS
jgi:DNA polymerase-3 subunit beta